MNPNPLYARRSDTRLQTLKEHCEAVAAHASHMGEGLGLGNMFRLCGLLHDLGKASPAFQAYLQTGDPSLRGTVVHAPLGAVFALRRWGRERNPVTVLLAAAIASHHGKLPDLINDQGDDYLAGTLPNDRFADLEDTASRFLAEVTPEVQLESLFQAACTEFTAYSKRLIEACSGLERANQTAAVQNLLGLTQRALFGALIDADRWDAYTFEVGQIPVTSVPPWDAWAVKLEEKLLSFPRQSPIDRLRAAIADDCAACAPGGAGIYRLNVPTGGGKTFSSLRFALAAAQKSGMERIVYVAPYKTILEQTARVFRETLGQEDQILEHHSDVNIDSDNSEALTRQQVLSQRWNAPLILTTAVQFLDTLFAGRSASVRRFPALNRCVILLDEVQCIPVRCWYLLTLAIRYLSRLVGCAVVLCTATQPMWEELPMFPLPAPIRMVSNEAALYAAFKRVEVTDRTLHGELTPEALAADVIEHLSAAGSALCILNTKKNALALYDAFKTKLPDHVLLYCLTTRQCPAHRLQLLDELRAHLKMGRPVVCIATQLIEAGVDISFGLTVRALAGLENLAQAAGRCNRNAERERGEVWLVRIADEALGNLPEIRRAQSETRSVLAAFRADQTAYQNDLLSPQAMERYFRTFIRDNAREMQYTDPHRKDGCTLLDLLSTNQYGRKAYLDFHGRSYPGLMAQAYRQAGSTFRALDSPTTPVLVPWGDGGLLIEALETTTDLHALPSLLRRLQRYTVSVYQDDLTRLQANHALSQPQDLGVWIVDKAYYDKTLGLTTDRQAMTFWDV